MQTARRLVVDELPWREYGVVDRSRHIIYLEWPRHPDTALRDVEDEGQRVGLLAIDVRTEERALLVDAHPVQCGGLKLDTSRPGGDTSHQPRLPRRLDSRWHRDDLWPRLPEVDVHVLSPRQPALRHARVGIVKVVAADRRPHGRRHIRHLRAGGGGPIVAHVRHALRRVVGQQAAQYVDTVEVDGAGLEHLPVIRWGGSQLEAVTEAGDEPVLLLAGHDGVHLPMRPEDRVMTPRVLSHCVRPPCRPIQPSEVDGLGAQDHEARMHELARTLDPRGEVAGLGRLGAPRPCRKEAQFQAMPQARRSAAAATRKTQLPRQLTRRPCDATWMQLCLGRLVNRGVALLWQ
eukprot:scaffold52297_cov63-Phaeocystis_antarctica.AAC.3